MHGFYVYTYLREDGSPYYVGKGKGRRAYQPHHGHRAPEPARIHIFPMADEATALAYECYLIDFWGRKDNGTGILRNLTDGGEGVSGFKNASAIGNKYGAFPRSEATRKRMSDASPRRKHTPEFRQWMSGQRKGKSWGQHTSEWCRERSEATKGRAHHLSDEARASIADSNRRRTGQKRPSGSNNPANHNRWHVTRGIVKAGCALCA